MINISEEDIKSLIQEWFMDCTTTTECALLYGQLYHELNNQLHKRMGELEDGIIRSNQNEQD